MKGLDKIAEQIAELQSKVAKVGWFESAIYPDGPHVATVVLIHELGAPEAHIPPRPFIKPTIDKQGDEWSKNIEQGTKAVLDGKITAESMLEIVGQKAAGDIRRTISEIREPELAESTLAQRRRDGYSDQPLNRTGYMITTCTNVVGDKE